MPLKRAASIDIGSNTTLFLVGDIDFKGQITIIDEAQIYNGLGKDVFQYGKIFPQTITRNLNIIADLILRASKFGVEEIIIAGTSALRSASNKDQFVNKAEKTLKVRVGILTGMQEDRLTYLGYLSGRTAIQGNILLADIGGGSSEFVFGNNGEIKESHSLVIGARRLMVSCPLDDPPNREKYRHLLSQITKLLRIMKYNTLDDRQLIFSGGAATTLATLKQGLNSYDSDAVEGEGLSRKWTAQTQEKFLSLNLYERRKLLHFDPDRAEIIIYGTAVILQIMEKFKANECRITHRGLRFGLLSEWGMGAGKQ